MPRAGWLRATPPPGGRFSRLSLPVDASHEGSPSLRCQGTRTQAGQPAIPRNTSSARSMWTIWDAVTLPIRSPSLVRRTVVTLSTIA